MTMPKGTNNGAKRNRSREKSAIEPKTALIVSPSPTSSLPALSTGDFQKSRQVSQHVGDLLAKCQASEAAAAIVPWFCDALPSAKSRKDYFADMSAFFRTMQKQGVHPYDVTGDHVAIYKDALLEQGQKPSTVARALSVLRGVYEQFGKKNFVPWDRVGDIQAVNSPKVTKNTTPSMSEAEACKLLHAPDTETILGLRDHAILFAYFKTACRCAAIANAKIGDLERTDTDWFLVVTEKGKKQRRQPLLEAAAPILRWVEKSGIGFSDPGYPLFVPLANDRKTPKRRSMSQQSILNVVKKYARQAGIQVDRPGRRGVCTHSLRKTALNNALEHGAKVEDVQQWAGHADLRTTQEYIAYKEKGAEEAARRCQIR
jgi:integrase/recombinase XerD